MRRCILLLLSSCFVIVLSSPRLPEVVYPKRDKDTIWAHAASQNGVSKGKAPSTPAKKSGNTSVSMGPVRNRTFAQKQYNQTKDEETRVILAPLEGEKVYTLEKFSVSREDTKKKEAPKAPKTAVSAVKTSKGMGQVKEMVTVDLKRTTMSEETVVTTTPKGLVSGNVHLDFNKDGSESKEDVKPKNTEPLGISGHVRLVSHDTSRSSSEIRFPAKQWQLPPSLLSARRSQAAKLTDMGKEVNSIEDSSFEEALELFSKNQKQTNHYVSMQKRNKTVSMTDVLQKTFGEAKPRPKMMFVDKQKFRATFASHKQTDKQAIIPLPPVPFGDETDMDLLFGHQHLPSQGFMSAQPNLAGLPFSVPGAAIIPGVPFPIGLAPVQGQIMPPGIAPPDYANQIQRPQPVPIQTNPALGAGLMPGQNAIVPQNQVEVTPATVPYQSSLDPNYKLDTCCRKQGVSAVCQGMCNFDTFNERSLVTAVISNQCPGPQLGQAFDCASSKIDHTSCCQRNNLHLYNGGQCMPFCRTHEPTPPNIFTYVACLQVFDTIKNCYREYQYTHPNIFGD